MTCESSMKQGCAFRVFGIIVLALVALSLVSVAHSQVIQGTIIGTVKDATGAVIAGATVTVRNVDTDLSRSAPTEADGSYRFPALPPGNYEVKASHEGFETVKQGGIKLAVADTDVQNITLQIGSTAQTVEVTTEVPLVNTTSGSLGGLVDEQKIQDLPLNGRSYIELSLLQLGVTRLSTNSPNTAGSSGIWYSSNGAPLRSNSYLLDGAQMVNETGTSPSSVANTSLGLDGIREFKIVTNASSAEYGLSMGSVMTIVTKSGTNQFHGDAFEFFRNSALDAANYFDPTPLLFPGKRIAPVRRNQFGGSVGGPIRKDKTYFYVTDENFESLYGDPVIANTFPATCFNSTTHLLLTTGNPCATDSPAKFTRSCPEYCRVLSPTFPAVLSVSERAERHCRRAKTTGYSLFLNQPGHEHYGQARIDQNLSTEDSLFGRYTIDDATFIPPSTIPLNYTAFRSRSQFFTLSESHIFTPTLLNTARFSFSRAFIQALASNPGYPFCPHSEGPCISNNSVPGTSLVCSTVYGPVNPGNPPTGNGCLMMGSVGVTGVSGPAPQSFAPDIRPLDTFSWSDDIYWTKGRHALKFGTLINHYREENIEHSAQVGSLSFTTIPNFFAGLLNSYSLTDPAHSDDTKYWRFNTLGFYVQDDFKATNRLTLNLGLRYEFETTYTEALGHSTELLHPNTTDTANSYVFGPPFHNPSLHNFSPRLGFAWDIFGNGKTALRGGFAELYDVAQWGSSLQQAAVGTPPYDEAATQAATSSTVQIPLSLPLVVPTGYTPTLRIINPYIKQPYIFQYNLGIERQLPGQMALSVSYGGSHGVHLTQIEDINPKAPEPGFLHHMAASW